MLYRIFTEDKNRPDVERIVGAYFPGFTLLTATGYWEGAKEDSIVVEIITDKRDDKRISTLADEIKRANKQSAILVERIVNHNWMV